MTNIKNHVRMQTRLIGTLCLLFWLAVTTRAQDELKIKSFEPRSERVIPRSDQRLDLDGAPCALIIVQVNDTIEHVEGNMMTSRNKDIADIPRQGKPHD